MKVIDPSEILTEQNTGTVNEETTRVNPWLRLAARFFDYALLILLFRPWFQGAFRGEMLVPFEYLVWIPIEALLMSTCGSTPGKWLLKIKLRHGKKKTFDFKTALKRSFQVWFRGLGMGIPVINFFCLVLAYHRLKVFHKTSWDRDTHVTVTHSPMAKWRIFLGLAVAVGGVFFYV